MFSKGALPRVHGETPIAASRYFALYITQTGWFVLGIWLLQNAYWPSNCQPRELIDIYGCSAHLAEGRGWIESGLMAWLWSTPMLIALEISRIATKQKHKPQRRR